MEFINLISNCLLQLVNIINSGYPENLSMAGEAMEIMDPETGAMVKQIISNTSGSSGCKEQKTIELQLRDIYLFLSEKLIIY